MPRIIRVNKNTSEIYLSKQEVAKLTETLLDIVKDSKQVPSDLREQVEVYHEKGVALPFLKAVLCNDLRAAVNGGTDAERECLVAIVTYVQAILPNSCWGSPAKVRDWMFKRNQERNQLRMFDEPSGGVSSPVADKGTVGGPQ